MGLSGPRKKQRIALDPQNQTWSQDTEKVSHRLMTTMGWSEGKGIGRLEDGIDTHIKVRVKKDRDGKEENSLPFPLNFFLDLSNEAFLHLD